AVGGYQYDYLVNEENEGDPYIIKTDAGLWLDTPQINEENVHRALVYPNPGNSEFSVRTTIKKAVFNLFDVNGRLLLEEPITELTTTINTSALPDGVYIWSVTQQGLVSDRGKWIKY
ncbi:MAG: T9SS type A sorting domain-containing protein, partial [Bacteroidales bacterium]